MIVEFQAVDAAGREVCDTIEATSVGSATRELQKRNLFVTKADAAGANADAGRASNEVRDDKARLSIQQLTILTRQMAMLLTSGSGVVPALNSISRQFPKPEHRRIVRRVAVAIEEGSTLTDALRGSPSSFDPTYCAIVAAGEASATLPEMFNRLAAIVGKRRIMRNKIMGAAVYPVLLICLCVSIIAVLLFFVMPRFGEMFVTLDVEIPASTAMLIAAGQGLRTHWLPFGIGMIALAAGGGYTVCSRAGRRRLGVIAERLPLLGRVIAGLILGETFRVMGMLIEARVGLLEVVDLVRGVTSNARYQRLYDGIADQVSSGGTVSHALERSGIVAPFICQAVMTGEESGRLGESMTYVADVLDEDNSELVAAATKLVEPIILIVMGFIVGGVAISLFLPLFDMTSAIG